MSVISVARVVQQDIAGIEVTAVSVADIISLGQALKSYGYQITFDCGGTFPGIGRLIVSRADHAAQFAYDGDWLEVANATFTKDEKTGLVREWSVSAVTNVVVYGGGPAQPLNVEDFATTFATAGDLAPIAVRQPVEAVDEVAPEVAQVAAGGPVESGLKPMTSAV